MTASNMEHKKMDDDDGRTGGHGGPQEGTESEKQKITKRQKRLRRNTDGQETDWGEW